MTEETFAEDPLAEEIWNPWDTLMKAMIAVAIQALVSLLLPGAEVLEPFAALDKEMIFNLYGKKYEADFFYKIIWRGRVIIFHIEFQKAKDPEMARRMWIYNTLMDIHHDTYVYSVLVYLTEIPNLPGSPYIRQIPEIPTEEGLGHQGFGFRVFKLFEDLDPELLLTTAFQDLLPIMSLTRGGQNIETVELMITEILARGLDHLLFLGFRFASLVLTDPEDQRRLKEMYHMVKNRVQQVDPIYQLAVDEGYQRAAAEIARAQEEAAAARQQAQEEATAARQQAAAARQRAQEEAAAARQRAQEEAAAARQRALEEADRILKEAEIARKQAFLTLQKTAIAVVVGRFPDLERLAQAAIGVTSDVDQLQALIIQLLAAPDQQQVQQLLFALVLPPSGQIQSRAPSAQQSPAPDPQPAQQSLPDAVTSQDNLPEIPR